MSTFDERVSQIVAVACRGLFEHYDVQLTELSAHLGLAPNLGACGIIGYSGDDMRGTLLLGASNGALQVSDANGQRDWLAELTNQLLGRIKNQLLTFGITIYSSTPLVLRGDHLSPMGDSPPPHLFATASGVIAVWFDSESRPGLEFAEVADASATVMEGEAMMF
ncbi:MAG: chemotaxis protein CheX [Deltaproteobacteria bacterium]|nr:chemotaxis protein CheX [Deltaproteobacteria bacterium]